MYLALIHFFFYFFLGLSLASFFLSPFPLPPPYLSSNLYVSEIWDLQIDDHLPGHIGAVKRSGHPVAWICDPMHGKWVQASFCPTSFLLVLVSSLFFSPFGQKSSEGYIREERDLAKATDEYLPRLFCCCKSSVLRVLLWIYILVFDARWPENGV